MRSPRNYAVFGLFVFSVLVLVTIAIGRAYGSLAVLAFIAALVFETEQVSRWAANRWLREPPDERWEQPELIDGDAELAFLTEQFVRAHKLDSGAAKTVTYLVHGARLSGRLEGVRECTESLKRDRLLLARRTVGLVS